MTLKRLCLFFLLMTTGFLHANTAPRPLRIVTTTPELASLALEIGRGCVQVTPLTKYSSNPRFAQPQVDDVIVLMEADLLIVNGLGLEDGWLPVLMESCKNNRIKSETSGFLDASETIEKLTLPQNQINGQTAYFIAQSHYLLDPQNLRQVALAIKNRLCVLSPQDAKRIEQNYYQFDIELQKKIEIWKVQLEPYRGEAFICQYPFYDYFARGFGFVNHATIFPRSSSGISKEQIETIIQRVKEEKIKMIWIDPWKKTNLVKDIADNTNSKIVTLNFMPTNWQNSFIETLDFMVTQLIKTLQN